LKAGAPVRSAATSYAVPFAATQPRGPCSPVSIATPVTNAYDDGVLQDALSYWYLVDAVNSCGAVP
jgi:hypothetical protein